MPRLLITRTLGPNIVAGSIRTLTGTALRQLCAEHGDDWFQLADDSARRQAALMAQTSGDAMVESGRRRARERQAVVA